MFDRRGPPSKLERSALDMFLLAQRWCLILEFACELTLPDVVVKSADMAVHSLCFLSVPILLQMAQVRGCLKSRRSQLSTRKDWRHFSFRSLVAQMVL